VPNLIVGETLLDFLCLGSRRGYFALEQLAYDQKETLEAYTNSAWQPMAPWHESVGFQVEDQERRMLDFLSERFGLRPWTEAKRFDELQARYARLLKLPPEVAPYRSTEEDEQA
jgi:hypothetical protein